MSFQAKKKWGQHFLNRAYSKRFAEAIAWKPTPTTLIEIGAGAGAISDQLLEQRKRLGSAQPPQESQIPNPTPAHNRPSNCCQQTTQITDPLPRDDRPSNCCQQSTQLILVEIDPELIQKLRKRYHNQPDLTLLEANILDHSFSQIAEAANTSALQLPETLTDNTQPFTKALTYPLQLQKHTHNASQGKINPDLAAPPATQSKWAPMEKTPLQPAKRLIIAGNFPYNISHPLLFKVFEEAEQIDQLVCILQREVAQRVCAAPRSKSYGIYTILLQTYFHTTYCDELPPEAFDPPPAVRSALIVLEAKKQIQLPCSKKSLVRVTKTAFSKRRKILANNWKHYGDRLKRLPTAWLTKRAEELPVESFWEAARRLEGADDKLNPDPE